MLFKVASHALAHIYCMKMCMNVVYKIDVVCKYVMHQTSYQPRGRSKMYYSKPSGCTGVIMINLILEKNAFGRFMYFA